ncbi:sensor histidine kinase [Amycolatopsis sp. cmx-4-68]|uniref:sensor histidine kinase n=1 Tax=Amycolatopsis sp. cmx-4-68 TaxID=2790938 RepID=UPI0039788A4D
MTHPVPARGRRALRTAAGTGLGALTALVEVPYVLAGALLLAVPAARPGVFRGARALAGLERARLRRFLGTGIGDDYGGARALQYLAPRSLLGLLAAGVCGCVALGAVAVPVFAGQLVTGRAPGGRGPAEVGAWLLTAALGLLAAFLCGQGLAGIAVLDRRLARRFLGPSGRELLRRRVSELATTRAEVVEAVNGERRRIERDLHDGVQQRIVALGVLLGRARRAGDPLRAAGLLRQAHEETQDALRELREVTWRVYPAALDESGLDVALESLAERATLPVELRYGLTGSPPPALATVAYFVTSEAVTNAAKHAAATRITIDVRAAGPAVVVEIADDGRGGARPTGRGGLTGLARRVAAADGEFTVDSPAGGPTVVRAVLPCA